MEILDTIQCPGIQLAQPSPVGLLAARLLFNQWRLLALQAQIRYNKMHLEAPIILGNPNQGGIRTHRRKLTLDMARFLRALLLMEMARDSST